MRSRRWLNVLPPLLSCPGAWALSLLVLGAGCAARPVQAPVTVDLLVIAPHPDDEVLMAGGVLERARRAGQRAAVVVLTNGDYTCQRDGWARQRESLAALGALGVTDVEFLGFPDGHLGDLGAVPLADVERLERDGRCVTATGTASPEAAPLTAESLTRALARSLARLQPAHVYLPHPADEHVDHSMTYAYFRRALERVARAPVVHRAFVHLGPCWPQGRSAHEPCGVPALAVEAPLPALPGALQGYGPSERVPVDAAVKLEGIRRFASQLEAGPTEDWLVSFARPEEVFFTERLVHEDGQWVRAPAGEEEAAASVAAGELSLEVPLHFAGERFALSARDGQVHLHGPSFHRQWRVPRGSNGPWLLEAELRRDEGGAQTFHLTGPEGYVGAAVRVASP